MSRKRITQPKRAEYIVVPTVADFKADTLRLIEDGVTFSDEMRDRICQQLGCSLDELRAEDRDLANKFINHHAWALVWLQNDGLIEKTAERFYRLNPSLYPAYPKDVVVPSVAELKTATLSLMKAGVTFSDEMRDRICQQLGSSLDELRAEDRDLANKFINNHAWALVRLQNDGLIEKTAERFYRLKPSATSVKLKREHPIDPPSSGAMPKWAKDLISAANDRNRRRFPDHPRFTEQDILDLWEECDGRCAVTGQEFTDERVGTGQAKRAFAPSLDRIDPEDGYHQANCRLVMAAVNFGMNAWGLEVYLEVARAAVKHSG